MLNNPINFIDPSGYTCVYSQNSGTFFCWDDKLGNYLDEETYSGAGKGKNDSRYEGVPFVGPIPKGTYTVGPEGPVPGRPFPGKQLIPDAKTKAQFPKSRKAMSFYIHGGYKRSSSKFGTASKGCIILNTNPRGAIPVGETVIVVE